MQLSTRISRLISVGDLPRRRRTEAVALPPPHGSRRRQNAIRTWSEGDEEIARLNAGLLGARAGIDRVDEDLSPEAARRSSTDGCRGTRARSRLSSSARVDEGAARGRGANVEGGGVERRDDRRSARRRGWPATSTSPRKVVRRELSPTPQKSSSSASVKSISIWVPLAAVPSAAISALVGALARAVELAAERDVRLLPLRETTPQAARTRSPGCPLRGGRGRRTPG